MKKEFYVGIILPNKSTIIKKVENHNSIESIMEFMKFKFGNNNYFIKSVINYTTVYWKIYKGKISPIGIKEIKNIETKQRTYVDYLGNYYICKNYPEFFDNKDIHIFLDTFNYAEEKQTFSKILQKFQNKNISINRWEYKVPAFIMSNYLLIDKSINHKYFDWLCKIYYEGFVIEYEDYDKTEKLLEDFDNPKIKALIKKNNYSINIMDYENTNELFKIIDEVYYSEIEKHNTKKFDDAVKNSLLYEDENWYVCEPKTHNESKLLGRRTNWCTAADSKDSEKTFNIYLNNGKLIIFINKNLTEKYQYYRVEENLEEMFLNKFDEDFEVFEVFDSNFIKNYYLTIKQKITLTELDSYVPSEFKMDLCHNLIDLDIFENDKNFEVSNMAKVKKYYT